MVESMNLQEKSNTFQKESETLTLPLTVSGICRVLGVNQTIQDKPISAICVDKNKAVEGCAFIAIKSKDSDMVKNVETVVSKGCAVVMRSKYICLEGIGDSTCN
jgi:UDP-N-acetylmuramyl pentapeptide synthase